MNEEHVFLDPCPDSVWRLVADGREAPQEAEEWLR